MSVSATIAALPREPTETRKLLLLIWAVTVATYLLTGPGVGPNMSTDDAMRLVQVRDLLAGQGWFDLTQYRLSPPEGVAMHWPRLIDGPVAILIRAGELVLSPALAERFALIAWPAMLLLALLFGTVRLARELADDAAARLALMFAALMAPVLQHFRPGAIDHHNAQVVLMVWSIALLVRERPRDAALSGALCALSLAIGLETVPMIAVAGALVTIRWMIRGEESRDHVAAFGIAFAAGTLVLFVTTVPPAHYGVATCDMLSIVHVLLAVSGGFGLAIIAHWRRLSTFRKRCAGAIGLAEIVSVIVVIGFPACLGDPLSLDPRTATLWLANINEFRSIVSMARDLPQEVLPYYGVVFGALVLGLYRCRQDQDPQRWGFMLASCVLAAATLIALRHVRGASMANALATAMVAAALVRGLPAPDGRAIFFGLGRAALLAALVLNPLTLIAAGKVGAWALEQSGAPRPVVVSDGPGTCRLPSDYAPLARLPKGLVLGFIDAGPHVLMETTHSVLAAPYHRNLTGNAAMFDVFLGRPEAASTRLAALGVDYVAFCPGAPERHNYAAAAPDGLAAALTRGDVPDGLERIPVEGTDLIIYRRR